jgi:hypothetical protein
LRHHLLELSGRSALRPALESRARIARKSRSRTSLCGRQEPAANGSFTASQLASV